MSKRHVAGTGASGAVYSCLIDILTGGQGSFTLQLDHYESAPPGVQKTLEQGFHGHAEA